MLFVSIGRLADMNACRKSGGRRPGLRLPIGVCTLALILAFHPATLTVWCFGADDKPASGLRDGWKWRTRIPELKYKDAVVERECHVTLSNENGWLVARRSTIDDDLEWQVVLARASDPAKPQITVNELSGAVEVRYRGYFIRENWGRIRIYRERKTEDLSAWPQLALAGERRSLGEGSCQATTIRSYALNQWCWIECGPRQRADVWLKLQPTTNRAGEASRGNALSGFIGSADGPAEMFYGDSQVQDEGDLLVGNHKRIDEVERGLDEFALDRAFRTKAAPALDAQSWLNEADPIALEKLQGRVVLLCFWSESCESSVKKLQQIEALHRRFKDRDFVIIGIHSADRGDKPVQPSSDNMVTFPIMVDSGETAKRYGVDALPCFFLIDKSGRVVWGYGMAPPSDNRIEKLLE